MVRACSLVRGLIAASPSFGELTPVAEQAAVLVALNYANVLELLVNKARCAT